MNRNFLLFLMSSASTLLGIEVFHLAIPLTVFALGYSAIQASWCTFAFFLPVIVVKIFAAPLIEPKNKKTVLQYNEIARLLCVILFVICFYLFKSEPLWFILPLSFLFGVFSTLTDITEPAALKLLLQGKNSTAILSQYEMRTRAVQLVAPTLCGILIYLGLPLVYLGAALISVISLLFLSRVILPDERQARAPPTGFYHSLHEAILWFKNHTVFVMVVMLSAINNFLHPILYLTIIYQLTTMQAGYEITGYILSGLGVGGLLGSFVSPYLASRFSFRTLVIGVNLLRIAVFTGFVLCASPWGYFIFFVLKAILGGIWNVCYNVYTIKAMPQSYVARLSALSGLIIKLATAIGSLLAGYAIQYLGVSATLYTLVGLTCLMLICSLPFNRPPS